MKPTVYGRLVSVLAAAAIGSAAAQSAWAVEVNAPDAVNRKALRVCGTPANLPYSDQDKQGFENKIVDIIADELKVPVEYTWFPQGVGFIRKTLAAKKCDLVPGTVQADEFTLNTNHYFRTTYALVTRPGSGLEGVTSLFDEKLKDKRVGIQAGAPAGDYVAKAGLMVKAKPYKFIVDTRYENPMEEMIKDLRSGEIDVAILWGPYAGWYANRGEGEKLAVQPMLEKQEKLPNLEYRITMGVRAGEVTWKRQINDIIKKRQGDIDKVLLEYGVPLIDEDNKLITMARDTKAADASVSEAKVADTKVADASGAETGGKGAAPSPTGSVTALLVGAGVLALLAGYALWTVRRRQAAPRS